MIEAMAGKQDPIEMTRLANEILRGDFRRGTTVSIETSRGSATYTVGRDGCLVGKRGGLYTLLADESQDPAVKLVSLAQGMRTRPVISIKKVAVKVSYPGPVGGPRLPKSAYVAGGVEPLTEDDVARTADHIEANRTAGGTMPPAVGDTLRIGSVTPSPDDVVRDVLQSATASDFEAEVRAALEGVVAMLVSKNAAYGDSALNPIRVFAPNVSIMDGLGQRADDKLSRMLRGHAAGEDAERDLLGYLVLRCVARARASAK